MGLNPRLAASRQLLRQGLPVAAASLFIAIIALALLAGGDDLRDALSLDRSSIAEDGEIWRLLTGHIVHLAPSHAVLNIVGVALVVLLVGREFRLWQWAVITAAAVATIDLGLFLFNPSLDWYVGLSGLLHGWLAAGIVASLRERRPDAWLLLALVGAKLVFEQWQGPIPGSPETSGGPVVVDAHLYGAIGGALAGFLLTLRRVRSS